MAAHSRGRRGLHGNVRPLPRRRKRVYARPSARSPASLGGAVPVRGTLRDSQASACDCGDREEERRGRDPAAVQVGPYLQAARHSGQGRACGRSPSESGRVLDPGLLHLGVPDRLASWPPRFVAGSGHLQDDGVVDEALDGVGQRSPWSPASGCTEVGPSRLLFAVRRDPPSRCDRTGHSVAPVAALRGEPRLAGPRHNSQSLRHAPCFHLGAQPGQAG